MPNYEYKCKECEIKFEIWQEVGADAPPCPECAGAVKKVLHAPKLHFKGSGFYVTDLRNEKSKGKPSEESAGAAKTETKTDVKSEAKTETKTDAKSENAKSESSAPAKTEAAVA